MATLTRGITKIYVRFVKSKLVIHVISFTLAIMLLSSLVDNLQHNLTAKKVLVLANSSLMKNNDWLDRDCFLPNITSSPRLTAICMAYNHEPPSTVTQSYLALRIAESKDSVELFWLGHIAIRYREKELATIGFRKSQASIYWLMLAKSWAPTTPTLAYEALSQTALIGNYDSEIWRDIGYVYWFDLHDREQAQDALKIAIKLDLNNEPAWELLLDLVTVENQISEKDTSRLVAKAVELFPNNAKIRTNIARFYFYAEDYNEAINEASIAIEIDQEYYYSYYIRASTYWKLADLNLAIVDYEKLVAIRDEPSFQLDLADLYCTVGRNVDGVFLLQNMTNLSANDLVKKRELLNRC